jgi:hypothetical protein
VSIKIDIPFCYSSSYYLHFTFSLANKSDLPNKMPLDKIRISFSKVISGRLGAVYSSCASEGTPLKKSGLPEAFDWLHLALEIQRSGPKRDIRQLSKPPIFDPSSETNVMQKLESWLTRIDTDLETEEFLERFRSFTLPSWDHYTHIRIAYVLLTKYGRKEGKFLPYSRSILNSCSNIVARKGSCLQRS